MAYNYDDIIDHLIDIRLGENPHTMNYERNCYNHIAAVITISKKTQLNILSVGINHYNNYHKKIPSIHAEASALKKLPVNMNKHYKLADVFVIRTSLNRKLGNSKPCIKCLDNMYNFALKKKGYKINNVYYSTTDGTIEKKKLTTLIFEEEFHVSRYYKKTNFKHPWMCSECDKRS